jgi:hypothetical protein
MAPTNRRLGRPVRTVLAAGSAALVAVLAYYEVLSYWFTGTDTIPLIETSRVSTLEGVLGIFAGPLMEGSAFTERALFYRPVASLSYAIDYAIWGLDPFGYHLTDLLLHATAAALVVWLVAEALDDRLTAAIAGGLFALHPLSVEVVPTPARRHDVLATVFALAAVCLFARATRTTPRGAGERAAASAVANRDQWSSRARRRWLLVGASVLSYLLAIGSKEIGALVPILIGVWFLFVFYERRPSIRRTIRSGVVLLSPYAVATAGYLALRFAALGGLGGYDRPVRSSSGEPIAVTVSRYVLSLVYPIDFLGALSGLDLQLIPNGLYVALAGASLLVVYSVSRTRSDRSILASARGRLLALSAVWFVLPVWLFVRTGRYTVRSGYISIVPVAVVLAVLFVTATRNVAARRREATDGGHAVTDGSIETTGVESKSTPRAGPGLATLAVVCVLCLSLVAGSGLLNPYTEWERAGEISEDTLEATSESVAGTPANATIDVAPVPHPRSARRLSSFPHARSVTFVWGNTISSWLQLQGYPGEREYHINDTVVLTEMPRRTTATVERREGRYRLTIHYEERCLPPTDGDRSDANGTGTPVDRNASADDPSATARVDRRDATDRRDTTDRRDGTNRLVTPRRSAIPAGSVGSSHDLPGGAPSR